MWGQRSKAGKNGKSGKVKHTISGTSSQWAIKRHFCLEGIKERKLICPVFFCLCLAKMALWGVKYLVCQDGSSGSFRIPLGTVVLWQHFPKSRKDERVQERRCLLLKTGGGLHALQWKLSKELKIPEPVRLRDPEKAHESQAGASRPCTCNSFLSLFCLLS